MKRPTITGDMIIADVIDNHPEVVDVLFNHGIQCFGCGAATQETLADGYRGHYGEEADVETFLGEINACIQVEVCVGKEVSSYDEPLQKVLFEGKEHFVCGRYMLGECDCKKTVFKLES